MMIPDDKVAEVRERAGIVEVVSDYMSLKKSGANYQGLCPFHGEKTPSFNVNPARGIFHCFGCGVGGNAITFVMKMEGLSFPEAVKLLAKRVGVPIEERPLNASEKKRLDEKGRDLKILSLAASYYAGMLQHGPGGEPGRRYLASRSVAPEVFAPYRLGYATESWDGLALFLRQQGIPAEQVERLGLIRPKSSGKGHYDLFRNRLIFTIANVHGDPIGFGGRVLDDSLPKYINSPESSVYAKSEVLFGIDLAKQAMREERSVIIVEGYFDHLALYRAGIRNAVATCGTALTNGHVQVVRRYAERVYLLFDGDSAGIKATIRGMELLLAEGMPCFVIEMPPGDDPDNFMAKHSAAEFRDLVLKARPALDYYLRRLAASEDTATVAGRKAVIDQFRPMLQKLADPMERDLYLRELARMLAVDVKSLGGARGDQPATTARATARSAAGAGESAVALLCRYPELADEFRSGDFISLLPAGLAAIAGMLLDKSGKGEPADPAWLLDPQSGIQPDEALIALLMDDSHLAELDPFKALADLRKALERQALKKMDAKSLHRELLQLDSDTPRYWEILDALNDLRNRKSQLS